MAWFEILKSRFFSQKAKSVQTCKISAVCLVMLTLCDPMDYSPPGPLSMGISRQEYWSGLSRSPPGDPHNSGIVGRFFRIVGRFFTI